MAKKEMYVAGVRMMNRFCELNRIIPPQIVEVDRDNRYYHLNTCAFYRYRAIDADVPTIWIMIQKCAEKGYSGRAWSWPGYVVDRTPYGVLQHELGHHVDHLKSDTSKATFQEGLYSYAVYQDSKEKPITGYLGTDAEQATFYKEWFAEIFRLFVTNPDLCRLLRPLAYARIVKDFQPAIALTWREILGHAPERTILQAQKKIDAEKAPVSQGGLFA